MSPIALFLASGDSIYTGTALLIWAVGATPLLRSRSLIALRNLALWLGLALIVMASPPLYWWIDGMFAAAFLFWLVSWHRFQSGTVRFASAGVFIALLLAVSLSELLHRRMPMIVGARSIAS